MPPQTLLKLLILAGVVLLVIAIGLRARLRRPLLILRQPQLALRSVLAMYVAWPLLALLPHRPGVGAALLGLAVSPVLPPWAKKGTALGGNADFVIGLQVLSCGVALLAAPLMIAVGARWFGVETVLAPWAVEKVLLVTVLAPLAVGLGLARLVPERVPRLAAMAAGLGHGVAPPRRGAVAGLGRGAAAPAHGARHGAALPAHFPAAADAVRAAAAVGRRQGWLPNLNPWQKLTSAGASASTITTARCRCWSAAWSWRAAGN
ncbi:MAG: hypothetical protein ACKOBY_01420 [Cyanobium sp.]